MKRTIKRVGMLLAVALLVALAVGAAAADTGEIAVTADVDGTPFRTLAKAAAADAAGNTVIAWVQSPGSYPYESKVYARHYDSSGAAGVPLAVVSLPGSRVAGYVDVAMNDSGAFVVAWTQNFTDAESYSVHAALYDSSATLVQGPFRVNMTESRAQWKPSVAIDDHGNFLVAWQEGPSASTPADTIYARFYDSTGSAAGGEFVVNTTTGGYRNEVDVSMAGNGRAAAVWHAEGSTVQAEAVYAQLFHADRTRNGAVKQLSTPDIATNYPAVAMDDSGGFVTAWQVSSGTVLTRQFDANGVAVTDELPVDTDSTASETWPDIATDGAGNFAVVWQSDKRDGASGGIYARFFAGAASPQGNAFRVNIRTDENEEFPVVSLSDTGHAFFAWGRWKLPNNGMEGLFARVLAGRPENTPPAVYAGAAYQGDEGDSVQMTQASVFDPDDDALTLSWTEDSAVCSFSDPNVLDAILSCTDDDTVVVTLTASDGTTTNASETVVTVTNVPPSMTLSGDTSVAVGDTYVLTLGPITDPGDDTFSSIDIFWGDGTSDTYSTTGDKTHIYAEPFDLTTIYGRITDEEGTYSINSSNWIRLTVAAANSAPTADAGGPYSGDEGSGIPLDGSGSSDPDGDALSYGWGVDADKCTFDDPSAVSPYLTCADNGSYTVTLQVDDGESAHSAAAMVDVANVAPRASFGNDGPVDEGGEFTLSLSAASDPGNADAAAGFTYAFDCGDGSGYGGFADSSSATCPTTDNGTRDVRGKVQDKDGGTSEYSASVTVDNLAPTIDAIVGPAEPVALGAQPVEVTIDFSDPGTGDTHTTVVDWGDGGSDSYQTASPVVATHTYAAAGVYALNVSVTDDDGAGDGETYEYIVVFDENSSVSGHGFIEAAPAWCLSQAICGGASGLAQFGFTARYQRGASTPGGRTVFGFRTHDFEFVSDSYEQLIVNQAGTNGQFKGSGLVNDAVAKTGAPYKFMIWATDGTPDMFRIKIWYEENGAETVVYDNGQERAIDRGQIIVSNR